MRENGGGMTDNRQAGWVDGLGVKRERARRECPHNFGNLQHCGFLKVASQSWPILGELGALEAGLWSRPENLLLFLWGRCQRLIFAVWCPNLARVEGLLGK